MDLAAGAGHIARIMAALPFLKMHGLGNDFVIVDARGSVEAVQRRVGEAIDRFLVTRGAPE